MDVLSIRCAMPTAVKQQNLKLKAVFDGDKLGNSSLQTKKESSEATSLYKHRYFGEKHTKTVGHKQEVSAEG
jgi:hypothetical protein